MEYLHIRHNNENLGPYTIAELKTLAIRKGDYIWKEGLADRTHAKSIPELNQLFTNSTPPPFIAENNINNDTYSSSNNNYSYFAEAVKPASGRSRLIWIGLLFVLSLITYIIFASNHTSYVSPFSTQKSAEELKIDLAQTEKQNPTKYISGRTSNHQNLINQTVLEGTLTNSATLAVFKDIVLQVDFLSKTNSIITTQNISVYEQITPGQTISFKKKVFVSKDVANVNVTIVEASPAN